jgi:hypothetical protein
MKINKKKLLIIGGVLTTGILSYFALKKRKIRFFDYVWCAEPECAEYSTQAQVDAYADEMGVSRSSRSGDNPSTGYYQLIFQKPHGLKQGEEIFIEQDAGAEFAYYDGWTTVKEVLTPYVIRTPKARQYGSFPARGGYVYAPSLATSLINKF